MSAASPAVTLSNKRITDAAIRLFAERGAEKLSVSDLALAAGVTRATIYNNCRNPAQLFGQIVQQMAEDLQGEIATATTHVADPAERLTTGICHFLSRAHDEPDWGAFIVRFALTTASLRPMLLGQPARDIAEGIEMGRFTIEREQIPAVLAMVGGSVLSHMALILDGHCSWRRAGADLAEFILRALGLDRDEARDIARRDLPALGT
ncbi:TetR/AcrR family transcriptional regulator [Frigidibacter sp.]|uniref:TetR/AcrR family transcriptional regulator n=1 Tax=Frigidibacter sp. TaxID=2586418 RepID=UPI002735DF1B|nr:TetR family transcriptional regulator [Frigidibacter sp.]MDP3340563.1 TetR family transcriptional regulator [Frigidibacter sp.]